MDRECPFPHLNLGSQCHPSGLEEAVIMQEVRKHSKKSSLSLVFSITSFLLFPFENRFHVCTLSHIPVSVFKFFSFKK